MNAVELDADIQVEPDLFDLSVADTLCVNDESGKQSRFVTFYFGDNLYGVPAEDVAEVIHPTPVSPIPNGPDTLVGISALRGEIIALIDLRNLLSEPVTQLSTRSKFILLNSVEDETRPGFAVDRMSEIVTLADGDISRSNEFGKCIDGEAALGGQVLHLLNAASVTASIAV